MFLCAMATGRCSIFTTRPGASVLMECKSPLGGATQSALARSQHVRKKHAEAAKQQNAAASYWDTRHQRYKKPGNQDDPQDGRRQ